MTDQATAVKTRDVTGSRYEPPRSHQETRRFYIGAGVFSILLAFAGFGPSLIDHSRRFAPPSAQYIAHGATNLAWLVLFLAQATLVARGRVATHRRLGWAGPVMAAAVIGMLVTVVHRDHHGGIGEGAGSRTETITASTSRWSPALRRSSSAASAPGEPS